MPFQVLFPNFFQWSDSKYLVTCCIRRNAWTLASLWQAPADRHCLEGKKCFQLIVVHQLRLCCGSTEMAENGRTTRKRHHSPVQITDSLLQPSWKYRVLHESHIKAEAPLKMWNCTEGLTSGDGGLEQNACEDVGTHLNKPAVFWVEFAGQKHPPGPGCSVWNSVVSHAGTEGCAKPSALGRDLEMELEGNKGNWNAHTLPQATRCPKKGRDQLEIKRYLQQLQVTWRCAECRN